MSNEPFDSAHLPPEIRQQVHELAAKLGCSEEEVVGKILRLVLGQLNQPNGTDLQEFVQQAKAALRQSPP